MKKTVSLALAIWLMGCTVLFAKSYSIEQLTIEAQVLPGGGLEIKETIRYDFRGSYRFAFREIPLKAGEGIEGIEISDSQGPYTPGNGEQPGSFEVSSETGHVKVTWYYRARDERRTFTFKYTLSGVVRRYLDVGEIYYQFVGDQWDHQIQKVSAVVRFPEDVDSESIRAWAHGPFHGTVSLPGDGTVTYEISPLPRRTFWEGRILFPVEGMSQIPLYSDQPARERITTEEAAWAEEANRIRQEAARDAERHTELASALLPASILSALIGLGIWTYFFVRFGKPYPQRRVFVPGELPSSHPPAIVSYLLHRQVQGSALVATLIDLARRGHLKIREEVREKTGWFGTKKETDYRFDLTGQSEDALMDFEKDLLNFIIEKAGEGKGFWMSRFKKVAGKNRSEFVRWFKSWRQKVERLGQQEEFFEPFRLEVLLPNILCGLVITGVGAAISVVTRGPAGVPAIVVGALQALLSGLLTRRTEEGQRLYRAWVGFKKHIKSMSKARGPLSLTSNDWGVHIVASILFGLHKEVGKLLEVSTERDDATVLPWYLMSESSHGGGIGGLGAGIASMVTTVSTAMSSASGMGGGASGGGGGGSGGGGGGAG